MEDYIKYHKWNYKDSKKFNKSLRNILSIKEPQLYFPIMSLFFYVYNTKSSKRVIDFDRDYFLKEVINYKNIKEYNSNIFLKGKIYDKINNSLDTKEIFAKVIPLLDPVYSSSKGHRKL